MHCKTLWGNVLDFKAEGSMRKPELTGRGLDRNSMPEGSARPFQIKGFGYQPHSLQVPVLISEPV